HVLLDVVEEQVHRRGGPPGGPLLGRRLERHLDVHARQGVLVEQRQQRRVHLVDHLRSTSPGGCCAGWTTWKPVATRANPEPVANTWRGPSASFQSTSSCESKRPVA